MMTGGAGSSGQRLCESGESHGPEKATNRARLVRPARSDTAPPSAPPRRGRHGLGIALVLFAISAVSLVMTTHADGPEGDHGDGRLDRRLQHVLRDAGFTGRVERTLEARLGRPLDPGLADLGRLLFFDKMLGLHNDNSCAGCHSPAFGVRRLAADGDRHRQQRHRRPEPPRPAQPAPLAARGQHRSSIRR